MHFSVLEKFGLSLLIGAWLIYGSNFLGRTLVRVDEGPTHAAVAVPEEGHGGAVAGAEPEVDFAVLLASAEPAAGEKVFGKCKACHTIEAGGAHKVGPNLHNIVGADKAARDGFTYSGALSGMSGGWTYENLNGFLESPKDYAPGTKMSFAGLKDPQQRAAVIAYMRANTDSPPPLPEAAPAPEPSAAPAAAEPATETAVAAAAAPAVADIGTRLASGDPDAGQKVFNKCKACHSVEQGGGHKVGPNLWGVVGADVASREGFSYSPALQAVADAWTYEALDAYLQNPKAFAAGNRMSFAGLAKPEDRANVILFLRQHSETPAPLP